MNEDLLAQVRGLAIVLEGILRGMTDTEQAGVRRDVRSQHASLLEESSSLSTPAQAEWLAGEAAVDQACGFVACAIDTNRRD